MENWRTFWVHWNRWKIRENAELGGSPKIREKWDLPPSKNGSSRLPEAFFPPDSFHNEFRGEINDQKESKKPQINWVSSKLWAFQILFSFLWRKIASVENLKNAKSESTIIQLKITSAKKSAYVVTFFSEKAKSPANFIENPKNPKIQCAFSGNLKIRENFLGPPTMFFCLIINSIDKK